MLLLPILILISVFSFFFTPILIRFAISNKYHKLISERDVHSFNIPNIGGVSIFMSFIIGFILIFYFHNEFLIKDFIFYLFFVLSFFLMFIIGLYDDLFNISFIYKFILQFFIAIIFVYFLDVKIHSFYGVFGLFDFSYNFLSFFSVFVFVFIMNSYNLIDGVDGLAAVIGIFICLIFAVIFYFNYNYFDCLVSILLLVSLCSFFYYNKPDAKIFMGDSGSLFVGFLISYLSINACNLPLDSSGTINPVIILCILIYPSLDTCRIFLLRIIKGESPFAADQNHIHHYLIKRNLKHISVSYFALVSSFFIFIVCYFIRDYKSLSFFVMFFLSIFFLLILRSPFISSKN